MQGSHEIWASTSCKAVTKVGQILHVCQSRNLGRYFNQIFRIFNYMSGTGYDMVNRQKACSSELAPTSLIKFLTLGNQRQSVSSLATQCNELLYE